MIGYCSSGDAPVIILCTNQPVNMKSYRLKCNVLIGKVLATVVLHHQGERGVNQILVLGSLSSTYNVYSIIMLSLSWVSKI